MAKTMTAASASTSLVRDGARNRSGISQMPNVSARTRSAAVGTSTAVSTAIATSAQTQSATAASAERSDADDGWDMEKFIRGREESSRILIEQGYTTDEAVMAMVAEEIRAYRREKAEQEARDKKCE